MQTVSNVGGKVYSYQPKIALWYNHVGIAIFLKNATD